MKRAGLDEVCAYLRQMELDIQVIEGKEHTAVAILSEVATLPAHLFSQIPGVEKILRAGSRHPLASNAVREPKPGDSAAWSAFGSQSQPVVIAGPCSVESERQIVETARMIKHAGAAMLRGGAFKPRTNPYDFPGLGKEGLRYLAEARAETGLLIVSEVLSAEQVETAEPFVDVLQIGTRNMYNYELLKEVGRTRKPVLLKRAMSATIDEFLQAAEYILLEGNKHVILCERGIRSFETRTRFTLDLNAVALLKTMCDLPVIVDPSHGTGRSDLVRKMSRAAIACGADGLIIEVHATPQRSISDAGQAIGPQELKEIVEDVNAISSLLKEREPIDQANTAAADSALSALETMARP